jgi:SET and MYND domain-containing protein 4
MLKLNEKSEQLRNEGNQLYARRNFHDALIKYNESLCLAENESENLGFAFANKSAVYFEMKMFEKCLRNIDLAFENKYPESNKKVLETRQNKCKQLIQKGIDEMNPITFFKDYQIENNSGIANCLEVKFNEKFGRHLITNKPLKVGDVIVVEKPFCKVLHEEFIFQRCGYCFKDNFMDLIPCLNCCKGDFVTLLL